MYFFLLKRRDRRVDAKYRRVKLLLIKSLRFSATIFAYFAVKRISIIAANSLLLKKNQHGFQSEVKRRVAFKRDDT